MQLNKEIVVTKLLGTLFVYRANVRNFPNSRELAFTERSVEQYSKRFSNDRRGGNKRSIMDLVGTGGFTFI